MVDLIRITLKDRLWISRLGFASTLDIPPIELTTNGQKGIVIVAGATPIALNSPTTQVEVALAAMLRGPAGDVGTRALVTLTAGAMVSGHRVIMFDAHGNGVPADPTSPLYSFVGVSISGANVGSTFEAQLAGLIEEPSFTLTPLLPIFVGPNGTLTQTPPTTGIVQVIGVARLSTSIFVSPQTPIFLG